MKQMNSIIFGIFIKLNCLVNGSQYLNMTLKLFSRFFSERNPRFHGSFWLVIAGSFILITYLTVMKSSVINTKCSPDGANAFSMLKAFWSSNIDILKQFGWISDQPRKKILLVTYMRSGSTFTGSILASHPDVLYFFEPLHAVHRVNLNSKRYRSSFFVLDEAREIDDITSSEELLQLVLESYLNCEFLNLDLKTLQDRFPFLYYKHAPFSACKRANPGIMGVAQCLEILYQQCTVSKATAIKTIRTPMTSLRNLLQDKDLKVIYLVRDPRAITLSRINLKRKNPLPSSYNKTSIKLCKSMLEDLIIWRRLKIEFPGQVMGMKYEDLAKDPIEVSRKMFRFIEMDFNENVEYYVRNITQSDYEGKCITCVNRKNSSVTAQKWRKEIHPWGAVDVDMNCEQVHSMLGYLPLTDPIQLVDLSFHLSYNKEF